MAETLAEDKPDFMTDLLFVQEIVISKFREKYEKSKGFRKDFLIRELSELESCVITCPSCKGIMRKAVVSKGVITCRECASGAYIMEPVDQIRYPINILEIKCPLLRDCSWTGKLCEAETHLAVCGRFKIFCPNSCGTVIKRCENIKHIEEVCTLRSVPCQFCKIEFTCQLLECHLEICSMRPIQCECGDEFLRIKLDQHIETECPLVEVKCPYAKYSCKIEKIHRKDLLAHKKEFYIKHQDMLEEESKRMGNKIKSSQVKVNTKRNIEFVECKVPNILSLDTDTHMEGPNIYIDNAKFKCALSGTNPLTIGIRKFQSNRTADLLVTRYQLRLSAVNDLGEPYTSEVTVGIKDVGNTVHTLFTLGKDIYSNYIQEDDSIAFKIFYDTDNNDVLPQFVLSDQYKYSCKYDKYSL